MKSLLPIATLLRGSLICLALSSSLATASPSSEQWQKFNQAAVEHHVIPRYQALAESATHLRQQSHELCEKTDAGQLQNTQQAFQQTMDAWQSIQHIRSGPIETMMRNYSMQFWPDKKNHVGKHLSQIISEKNPQTLNSDDFYSITVAVRGLPAIERLLYSQGALDKLVTDPYRCQVLQRIAAYVAEMSTAMVHEWQQDMVPEFQTTGGDDSLYESHEEAAVVLLKPMVESLEIIKDLKIQRVLGSSPDNTKPRRLESWRSERSLDNLKLNFAAIQAIYQGEGGSKPSLRELLSPTEVSALDANFAAINEHLADIKQPMETAITTDAGYAAYMALAGDTERLLKTLQAAITDNGIFLGFNSRDGD